MNVKQAINTLQLLIDNGVLTGEETFGTWEYSGEEGTFFNEAESFETHIDENTEETYCYF